MYILCIFTTDLYYIVMYCPMSCRPLSWFLAAIELTDRWSPQPEKLAASIRKAGDLRRGRPASDLTLRSQWWSITLSVAILRSAAISVL